MGNYGWPDMQTRGICKESIELSTLDKFPGKEFFLKLTMTEDLEKSGVHCDITWILFSMPPSRLEAIIARVFSIFRF
jgi:hypothetical protein